LEPSYEIWYGNTVGGLILFQWVFLLGMNSVPELKTAPWEIGAHLSAELLVALVLIIQGITALKSIRWGARVLFVALGIAVYSEITSPGYFAQLGQWALLGSALSIIVLMKKGGQR